MLILGVDPGLTRCGLGLVETGGPGRARLVSVEVARSAPHDAPDSRLDAIGAEVERLLDASLPAALAIERVFAQHNVRSVMGTAQVSGVVMREAARRGIPVATYTPSEIKAAVTGNGRAPKTQVAQMVTRILSLDAPPTPADAADALAIAICHAWRGATQASSAPATAAQRRWAEAERASRRR
jgi:crossover junction endodeoxyribonuclease RuvC